MWTVQEGQLSVKWTLSPLWSEYFFIKHNNVLFLPPFLDAKGQGLFRFKYYNEVRQNHHIHRLSVVLQLQLHSWLNIWLQWIGLRQLQDKTRNIHMLEFRCVLYSRFDGTCFLRNFFFRALIKPLPYVTDMGFFKCFNLGFSVPSNF